MGRAAALLIVLGTTYAVHLAAPSGSARPGTALALGFALIAAALAGELLELVRLPRIAGYLLFGLVCGPYIANLITRPMARELQLINGVAIALIAFIAGLELNVAKLRAKLAAVIRYAGVSLGVIYVVLLAVFWIAWPWLPILPEATGLARVALAVLLTTIVASFSPAVTIAVIADSRSKGPLSELTMTLVILADLALIIVFTLSMQAVRWVLGDEGGGGEVGLAARLGWEVLGSFAIGAIAGALFAWYLRYVGREVTVVLLGLCVFLGQSHALFHAEPLLAALAAGLVVENVAPPEGEALKHAVERGSDPVLVIFFAAAGTSLELDALATLGVLAVTLFALRLVIIWLGGRVAQPYAPVEPGDDDIGHLVWMGLVSQAGVVIGLAVIVANEFPGWGTSLQTLVIAIIGLNQFIGPILFRAALGRAGEVGNLDRPPVAAPELAAAPEAGAAPAT